MIGTLNGISSITWLMHPKTSRRADLDRSNLPSLPATYPAHLIMKLQIAPPITAAIASSLVDAAYVVYNWEDRVFSPTQN